MSTAVLSGQNLRKSEKFAIIASKGGAAMASKYDNMSREELLAAMKEKNKSKDFRAHVVLTTADGEILKNDILPSCGCENISQLVRKIVHGELIVSPAEPSESN